MTLKRPLNQFLASTAMLAAVSLQAQPEVRVDYRFYSVSPQTYEDLKTELDANSPIRMGGRVAHGHTRINLQWRPIMIPSSSGCTVSRIDADLGLRYTLPQLELTHPNEELSARFAQSYDILHAHEIGHGNLAIEAAREIDRQLVGMGHSGSCAELEQQAIAIAGEIYKHYKEKELEYDRITDHGRNQHAQAEANAHSKTHSDVPLHAFN